MKRLITCLLFAATICTTLSFAPGTNPTKKVILNAGDFKYYYFQVQTLDKGYYFSSIIEVEAKDYTSKTYEKMMNQKGNFKRLLKRDYDLDWPLSNIKSFEFNNKDSAEEDRKTRIGYGGDNVKYIDL